MAHPDAYLPIDESVKIPDVVKRAARAAEAHYAPTPAEVPDQPQKVTDQSVTSPREGDQPINIAAVPAETPPAAPRPLVTDQVQPAAPVPVPTPEEIKQVDWAAQYNSMRGRWAQSQQILGSAQEQVRTLSAENARMAEALNRRQAEKKLLTPEDEKAYGPELIDMTRRAARDALQQEIDDVRQQQADTVKREQRMQNQMVFNALDTAMPDWRTVNNSDDFKGWLSLPDVYSNRVRHDMLLEAFHAAAVPRILAFFNAYLAEAKATGQLPAPSPTDPANPAHVREAAVTLASLAAPGRAQPASETPKLPSAEPHFTEQQIAEFYSHKGMQRYVGREADRKADEQLIFEAQKAGRIHYTRRH